MNDAPQPSNDLWNWVVIALICGATTLVLYAPLIWELTHGV
jgi:hypothetical protein